jgi:hypothetical protein
MLYLHIQNTSLLTLAEIEHYIHALTALLATKKAK